MGLDLKPRGADATTAAHAGTLTLGKAKMELPNRLPTGSEANASRVAQQRDRFEGQEVFVAAKLMGDEKLKGLLTDEATLQKFAKNVQGDARLGNARAKMLFLVMRGEATIDDSDHLRTLLDLQWLTDQDAILVQHGAQASSEDLVHDYTEAKRWLKQRSGEDKPLLPVVTPVPRQPEAERLMGILVDRGAPGVILDLQGKFPYHLLRAVEKVKRKHPELWVHAFQAPPKARFGGARLHLGWGMVLPIFGIDSFSRWVVPPPPVPVTREKINFWEPAHWGVMRLEEYQAVYGDKLSCKCPICRDEKDVDTFLTGDPRILLAKSKTHDHFAQRLELEKVQKHVRDGKFGPYVARKRFAKEVAQAVKEAPGDGEG